MFKFGSLVSPEWIGRHYITEIANTPKMKLRDMIADIKQRLRCVVSIGQVRRAKKWATELIEGKLTEHYARGLVEAVKDILPNVEHRQCARHVYANFKKAYTGLEFKKLFWAASMSCVESYFMRHMETIKKLSPSAYDYLMSRQPKTWCRAYFDRGYACEAVEN
uniref:MULE transposase domain-containing protein n=1 Tax=Lactuca sativa TaxID=4236 RepID=A0A9R1XIQ7_LACSA|nr:hypothetical protein LSAT_V11C300106670 [Lactuca sativa]